MAIQPFALSLSPSLTFSSSPLITGLCIAGAILIISGILMWPLSYFVASWCVFNSTLRKKAPDTWGRAPSSLDPDHLKMDEIGLEWQREYNKYKTDVHIVNEGFNLYGEYYDIGSDRCMIFLSGRTESLRYGYYFARPYTDCGYNVLLIDPRAHGLSDGEFNTVGFDESRDDIAWARFIHDTYGINSIVFHGICIGAAGGMLALTSDNCPDYIDGIVTEGMFTNFGESMKNHLIEKKKPVFIFYDCINMWFKHFTGHSMSYGPIDVIGKLKKPLLIMNSKEDIYSLPENAKLLYDTAGSEKKRLVYFEHGAHSMLRFTDTEKYDRSIAEFTAELYSEEPVAIITK